MLGLIPPEIVQPGTSQQCSAVCQPASSAVCERCDPRSTWQWQQQSDKELGNVHCVKDDLEGEKEPLTPALTSNVIIPFPYNNITIQVY